MSEEQKPTEDPTAGLIDKIPEKFRADSLEASIEKLVGSYTEVEKKVGQKPEIPNFDSREAALEAAGLSMGDLSKEWVGNDGKLGDSTYEKLSKVGLPKYAVDTFAEAVASRSALLTETVYAAGGGEESTKALLEWARTDAPKGIADKYEQAISSGDILGAREATMDLAKFYAKANGTEGSGDIRGGEVPQVGPPPFATAAERKKASARAAQDESYRDEYAKRLAATQKKNPSAMV